MSRARRPLLAAAVAAAAIAVAMPTAATASSAHVAARPAATPSARVVIVVDATPTTAPSTGAVRARAVALAQAPLVAALAALGARDVVRTTVPDSVIATVPSGSIAAIRREPGVESVAENATIPGPTLATPSDVATPDAVPSHVDDPAPCGTADDPEADPEALSLINATPGDLASINGARVDGAGVTVAFLADGIDTTNPDLQRNAAYGTVGEPVATEYDFSTDGTDAPTAGGEAFGDASSIAAQGNDEYDLNSYVSPSHPLASHCDITITGDAPGVDLDALKIYAQTNDTTTSGFVQAINFAVTNGAKVINESFGSNNVPDSTLDVIRDADDAAVAAGVTVVVSSGDAGNTGTIGSPASDPSVISVGASTSFRAYAQDTFGGIDDPASSGAWVDDNISSLSSGGVAEDGSTVDLVAPGDLNWALCSSDVTMYSDCTNESNDGADIQLFGGTSEAAPLTAGAAADVIQAYAATHDGTDPTPAAVKQILMSTATDIDAPADEQGAGLLDVEAAVKEAESMPGTTATPDGGVVTSPGQIDVTQREHATSSEAITLRNTSSSAVTVSLSTRALTDKVGDEHSSFCMQPSTPTATCPANTGTFAIWSGVTEVYQNVSLTVPSTTGVSRLEFAADYQYTDQSSLLHFALIEPDGAYAAYSLPQGVGDYGEVEVANPPAGVWTAVFFTEQDTADETGTTGTIQWDSSTYEFAPAGTVSPSSVTIEPGSTATAHLAVSSPATPGDTDQSVVVSTPDATSTIPVIVRTIVATTSSGGTFAGVLTGGNGRAGAPAQTNTYDVEVPAGAPALSASVTLSSDPGDALLASLIDPEGQTLGYSSNATTDNFGVSFSTTTVSIVHVAPQAGLWQLVLAWQNPVTGLELTEPFTGTFSFGTVPTRTDLPDTPSATLTEGVSYSFHVRVTNTTPAPEAYFVDPRLDTDETIGLVDENEASNPAEMVLPLASGLSFPYYFVPPDTTTLTGTVEGSVPVTFDMESFPGDPDVSPVVAVPSVRGSEDGDSATLSITEPEVAPGLWLLNPDEIGPYPSTGAPGAVASASVTARTRAFDPAISSSTGDLWSAANGLTETFDPTYVPSGDSTEIDLTVTPSAKPGTVVRGELQVDDFTLGSLDDGPALPDGDELATIPYAYTVAGTTQGYFTATSSGTVHHFGTGTSHGSPRPASLHGLVVAMAVTPSAKGYWLATANGHVVGVGDAAGKGGTSDVTAERVAAICSDTTGAGYWVVTATGLVSSFGDAGYYGSAGGLGAARVVAMATTDDGRGYWLATSNGRVLSFGDAAALGSPAADGDRLASGIVAMAATPGAGGYLLVTARGHVYAFGTAVAHGSLPAGVSTRAVAIVPTPTGAGYWIVTATGRVVPFGHAGALGAAIGSASTVAAASANP